MHLCSGTESRFMQASMAATAGKPIISDEEYDDLKAQLRNKNSVVVQQVCLDCADTRKSCDKFEAVLLEAASARADNCFAQLLVLLCSK